MNLHIPENPQDYSNLISTLDLIITFLGALGAIVLFIIGLNRYKKEQTWKRNEFVANEMKEFNADKIATNAMYMLDWSERYIELFPGSNDYSPPSAGGEILYINERGFVKIDWKILRGALIFHELLTPNENGKVFSKTEMTIRDTFDHFFSYFEKFYQFIEADLITEKELRPYLIYWINTIGVGMDEETRNSVYHYIEKYGYSGTQKLIKCYGHDIKPKTDIYDTLKNRIEQQDLNI